MPFARPRLRPLALAAAFCLVLAGAGRATWSIIIVDTSTNEVAIGCATCLSGFDLVELCPVMVVGVGGACAQSSIDSTGANRGIIWQELMNGTKPNDIIQILKANDGAHQSRQYGIVDVKGRSRTFTGNNALAWAGGLTGTSGNLVYSIQGNILTGQPVVDDAEQAILNTPGDVAEKLMAAMEAAAAQGGDKRCNNAGKTAHIGFMQISRMGDTDGVCNGTIGCSNGSYYMDLNVPNQGPSRPDPVIQLRTMFNAFRAAEVGRPDHFLSTKAVLDENVPGNGTATTTLTIQLNDWQGFPVTSSPTVTVQHGPNSAGLSTIGPVVDNGNGLYTVSLTAGVGQGKDKFLILADDGIRPVQLFPNPKLVHGNTLDADVTNLSAGAGGTVNFTLIGPEDPAGKGYFLLASTSGTNPGTTIGGVVLPLNMDLVLLYSFNFANSANFVNTRGTLGADGTGAAQFVVGPNVMNPLIGGTLSFAYMTWSPVDFPSNALDILIDP